MKQTIARDSEVTFAIIGGGPAGLSLARLLVDHGIGRPTVFEKNSRVGGKSRSIDVEGTVLEMGTTYASLAHKITNRWMKAMDLPMRRIGEQKIDGMSFQEFVATEGGPPLMVQVAIFLFHRQRLMGKSNPSRLSAAELEELATPAATWVAEKKLPKIKRFLWRAFTSLGYGHLDETPILHVFRWCDFDLIRSGLFNKLYMPVLGWTDFWERISDGIDVRLAAPVEKIDRSSDGVTVQSGVETFSFDYLIVTTPIDELVTMTDPTAAERYVARSVQWQRYVTTLCAVRNWFDSHYIEVFSNALRSSADKGKVMSSRIEDASDEFGGKLYISGQYAGPFTNAELEELAAREAAELDADYVLTVDRGDWKYGPRYESDAIKNGLLTVMHDMQGQRRTFYSGATFSHEAVSNIVNFNAKLVRRVAPAVRDDQSHAPGGPS